MAYDSPHCAALPCEPAPNRVSLRPWRRSGGYCNAFRSACPSLAHLTPHVQHARRDCAVRARADQGANACGIAKAKAEGKYRGRAPTARMKAEKVKQLRAAGLGPSEIARQVGISRTSVFRILTAA